MLEQIKNSSNRYEEEDAINDILSKYWRGELHLGFDRLVEDINNITLWNIVDDCGDVWYTDY